MEFFCPHRPGNPSVLDSMKPSSRLCSAGTSLFAVESRRIVRNCGRDEKERFGLEIFWEVSDKSSL